MECWRLDTFCLVIKFQNQDNLIVKKTIPVCEIYSVSYAIILELDDF